MNSMISPTRAGTMIVGVSRSGLNRISSLEILFNPDLDTPTIMVPALVGLIMLFIGALATSLGVVRERQDGTLEQLAVLPLSPADLFVGKLAPYLVIAVIDLAV